MIIFQLSKVAKQLGFGFKYLPGRCANCNQPVFESELTLDDCYNVWAGTCPYCKAVNLLSMDHGLRGYDSKEMHLVLPTDEEVQSNEDLPRDCPTQGSKGPATCHGSPLGEIQHILRQDIANDKT